MEIFVHDAVMKARVRISMYTNMQITKKSNYSGNVYYDNVHCIESHQRRKKNKEKRKQEREENVKKRVHDKKEKMTVRENTNPLFN